MDPKTGEVVAMASSPGFDLNDFLPKNKIQNFVRLTSKFCATGSVEMHIVIKHHFRKQIIDFHAGYIDIKTLIDEDEQKLGAYLNV